MIGCMCNVLVRTVAYRQNNCLPLKDFFKNMNSDNLNHVQIVRAKLTKALKLQQLTSQKLWMALVA